MIFVAEERYGSIDADAMHNQPGMFAHRLDRRRNGTRLEGTDDLRHSRCVRVVRNCSCNKIEK
jgi:hypothetical protein